MSEQRLKLIECVPNFSEGRDREKIDSIASAIRAIPGAHLLDVDANESANRTVMTIAGEAQPVIDAAFSAIERAASLIDMRYQTGEHPRIGACDVCPIVPLSGSPPYSMIRNQKDLVECVEYSKELGERVGKELGIPIFLYEESATSPERRALPFVRKGQYEGLKIRMEQNGFLPDFGPSDFNERSGATIIGARGFLIAYNINLGTRDPAIANDIAQSIRESGKFKREANGRIARDSAGRPLREAGRLKALRAVGWLIDEFDCAQVSMNLIDPAVTGLYEVFSVASKLAEEYSTKVTGSEVVGLVPYQALLDCGIKIANRRKDRKTVLGERQATDGETSWNAISDSSDENKDTEEISTRKQQTLVELAVRTLGLNHVKEFNIEQKILENRLKEALS